MTINKFQGKTKEEAIEKAKKAFGETAVIMNVKEVKPKGIFKMFKKSSYEVTAAMEEKENYVNPMKALHSPQMMHDSINLAADEDVLSIKKAEPKVEVVRENFWISIFYQLTFFRFLNFTLGILTSFKNFLLVFFCSCLDRLFSYLLFHLQYRVQS